MEASYAIAISEMWNHNVGNGCGPSSIPKQERGESMVHEPWSRLCINSLVKPIKKDPR